MSLFIPYKDMWDMPLGGTSKEKQIPHWAGNFFWVVLGALCKIVFRYRVDGRENLRGFLNKSGVLVVSNHTSFLDVVFMYLAARPVQWVRFLARESLFDNAGGLAGQIISRVGAFPIKRDTADRTAIKRASRMLKNKEAVGIFPEGTRRGKGSVVPQLHSGAAFIAKMGKAPILPMTVRNAECVKRKGERIRFPKITVEYGHPVLVSDFDFLPKEDRLDGCAWYVMRECFALSWNVAREQVDMSALFPESRDFSEEFLNNPIPDCTTEQLLSQMSVVSADEGTQKDNLAAKATEKDSV